MGGSIPGTVGTRVSDPWCVASSETSDSQSFLEWSFVCPGEQSCSVAVSQGRSSPRERRPRGTSSEPGPRLLLGPVQSFPAVKAVQYRLKEKMVQNPVGFWWELIDKHLCPQNISLVSLRLVQSLFECLTSRKWLELCTTVGLGRADRGSPGCCFPLSCRIKSCSEESGAALLPAV